MPRGKSHVIRHEGLFSELKSGDQVWAYLRHSPGEDQDIRSQRRAVAEYCERQGLVVAHWWIDEAKGGGSMEGRDQFEAMLAASRQTPPPVAGIVVWDFGRISRDDLESQFVTADLRLRGYRILSINDDIPGGEFAPIMEAFIRWKNARFLRDLQANVHRGLDSTVKSEYVIDGVKRTGFSGGGFPPRGYEARRAQVGVKKSGKPMLVSYWLKTEDPDLRAGVDKAWQMAIEAAAAGLMVPVGEIHRQCKVHGAHTSYYSMFHSPTYAGIRQVGKRRVLDAHEAYVSLQDWQAVQPHVPHDRAVSIQRHPRRLASPFPLSGFAFCGYCGAPLNCEPDNRVPNYSALRCSNRKHDSSACRFARMSAGAFLSGLIAFVTAEVMTEDRFRAAVGELNRLIAGSRQAVAKERRALMKEIAVVDRVIDRLLDAIEAGQGARVQGRIEQREKEKAELQARLTRLADDREMRRIVVTDEEVHETIQEMHKDLQSGDPATLRRMLQALIRRVDVCSDRVQVAWVLPLSLLTNKTVYAWYPQGGAPRRPDVAGAGEFAIGRTRHIRPA